MQIPTTVSTERGGSSRDPSSRSTPTLHPTVLTTRQTSKAAPAVSWETMRSTSIKRFAGDGTRAGLSTTEPFDGDRPWKMVSSEIESTHQQDEGVSISTVTLTALVSHSPISGSTSGPC